MGENANSKKYTYGSNNFISKLELDIREKNSWVSYIYPVHILCEGEAYHVADGGGGGGAMCWMLDFLFAERQ